MSINVGELVATLRLDDDAFRRTLAGAPAQGQRQGDEAGRQTGDGFVGGLKKTIAGAGAILAGGAVAQFFKSSIDAASDMNETLSKSGVIFGKQAEAVRKWATTAATSLGLSQQAAINSATSFGDMFLQLGLSEGAATDLSMSTVQLAADLGSFSNLETGDVLERISGALRGEYDSLQAVIPNISAARVEHEALAASGKKSASELTAAEKAQATLAIVAGDGSRALGDFARTADGAANTSKILAAQWSDLQVEIGNRLMPAWQAFQDLLGVGIGILGDLVGVVGQAVDWFSQLPDPVKAGAVAFAAWVLVGPQVIGFVKGLAFVLPTILSGLGGVGGAARAAGAGLLTAFGGPIGLAILGVTAAIGFLISQTDKVEVSVSDFGEAIDETTGKLKDNSEAALSAAAAQSGHIQAYKAIGGAAGDYVRALQGVESEQDAVHTQLLDSAVAALKNTEAWDRMIARGGEIPGNARKIASSILETGNAGLYASEQFDAVLAASAGFASDQDVLSTAAETAAAKLEAEAEATKKAGTSAEDAADPTDALKEATKELGKSADAASITSDFLWQSLLNFPGVTISAEQATMALEAAFRDMEASARGVTSAQLDVQNAAAKTAEAQAKYDDLAAHLGTTLDGQAVSATNLAVTQEQVDQASRDLTAAQLAERGAADDVTNAQDAQTKAMINAAHQSIENAARAYELKAATGDTAGATRDLQAATEQARTKFIETAQQMGYTESQAKTLADQYGLVPSRVVTEISTPGMSGAQQDLAELSRKLREMPDSKIVKVAIESGDVTYSLSGTTFKMKAGGGEVGMFGPVSGHGNGMSDSVGPVLLSDREWVTRQKDRDRPGNEAVLQFIHNGGSFADVRRRAGGGSVGTGITFETSTAGLGDLSFMDKLVESVQPRIKEAWDKIMSSFGGGSVAYNPTAGVEQWRGLALQALAATGESPSNINALLYQMQTESGGNPNAINLWDINAQRGYPSMGLLQVIRPTFESALRGTQFENLIPRGQTDPWANIIASILYARRRYGSLANAYRGVAYDSGGVWPDGTAGVNTSGEDEFVLTGPQARAAGLLGSSPTQGVGLPPLGALGMASMSSGRSIAFTGPIQVGSFQSAADLINHALYVGL